MYACVHISSCVRTTEVCLHLSGARARARVCVCVHVCTLCMRVYLREKERGCILCVCIFVCVCLRVGERKRERNVVLLFFRLNFLACTAITVTPTATLYKVVKCC